MKANRSYEVNMRVFDIINESDKKMTRVADKAGISRDIFSRIIHSKRPIYADEIVPICSALGVSVESLFTAENKNDETAS